MKLSVQLIMSVAALISSIPQLSFSQSHGIRDCGTKAPATPLIINVDEHPQRNVVPLMMKIFVHIIADGNGANVACGDSSILRQLENMQGFYAPHSICFQLLGMDIINDTDLNTHNADHEELELLPYMVNNTMNIFVHWDLFNDDENLNGIAYGIPNSYLSVSRGAITSITNRSTLAHEMGHCLGLYHTFEVAYGEEEIPRTGDCKNCGQAGDFLCDTEADPHSDEYDTGDYINTSCIYTDYLTRECGDVYYEYDMDPHNLMAYGRRSCRDLFTNGQGARMSTTIISFPILSDRLSSSSVVLNENANVNISSGTFAHGAESSITVQGNEYVVSGSARGYFNAPAITIKPNVRLQPGADGFCRVYVDNPTCD